MPAGAGSDSLQVTLDARELASMYKTLKAMDGDLQVGLRRGIVAAAKPLVFSVRAQASFSQRIPASIKTKVSFSVRNASVSIVAGGKAAPEAAALNNKGRSGTFRHPVFGRDVYVPQRAEPFMTPSTSAASSAQNAILAVMDDVAKKAGFR